MAETVSETVAGASKTFFQSRTIRIAILFLLGGGLDLLAKTLIDEGLLASQADITLMVTGVVMAVLRKITSQPIG